MRILKVEEFEGWGKQEVKLVEFVNEHHIKQEDIVKINKSTGNIWHLFYYAED